MGTAAETNKLVPLGILKDTKKEMDIENLPTVETVPDENNNDAKITPINHGAPADANKTPVTAATNMVTMAADD